MKKNKLIVDNARNMHKSITFILGALLAIVSFLEIAFFGLCSGDSEKNICFAQISSGRAY